MERKKLFIVVLLIFNSVYLSGQFCIPSSANGPSTQVYINSVSLRDLSHTSTWTITDPGYNDFTALSTILDTLNENQLTITGSPVFISISYYAWIDYNKDNDFSDTGELIGSFSPNSANQTGNINFYVPDNTLPGPKRLRITCMNTTGSPDPCSSYTDGETEDYTIIIPGFVEATTLGIVAANIAWGDYDNDNDLDLVMAGANYSYIYRNEGNDVFTTIDPGLQKVSNASVAWCDYDNDGDLDLALMGMYNPSTDKIRYSKIYRNDGSDVFTDINAGLTGLYLGSIAWGDYDNDGKTDLLISGLAEGEEPIGQLYHNEGNDIFSDSKITITPCTKGKIKWGDYDNDNLLDILMLGQDFNGNQNCAIYHNTGENEFVDINANLPDGSSGSADLGDYDNDGDLDVLIGGQYSGLQVYRNDGGNTFTNINLGLPYNVMSMSTISLAWGDYDNDGDLDFIAEGAWGTPYGNAVRLFQNQGSDIFTEVKTGIVNTSFGSLAWGDYDNDLDLDLIITGSGILSRIYKNYSFHPNSIPTEPTEVKSTVINDGAILSWKPSSDNETNYTGLSYNVRIGSGSTSFDILSPMADLTTGTRTIPAMGNSMPGTSYNIKKLPVGIYHWSVQAVDNSFKSSSFSSNGSFEILTQFTDMNLDIVRASRGALAWGDYDNDGDLDFVITGLLYNISSPTTNLYQNNGSGGFSEVSTSLPAVQYSSVSWGDYDNDNDLDLFISGQLFNATSALSRIYRNNGGGVFSDINAGIVPVSRSGSSWGDYDNDGDLDLLLTGLTLTNEWKVIVYRNDGGGIFIDINFDSVETPANVPAAWGDFDNDNDLDIIVCGQNVTDIYLNSGNDLFVPQGLNLPGNTGGIVSPSDFDNDGDLDLLISGTYSLYKQTLVLRNNGNLEFTDINAGLRGVGNAKGGWGDLNNDGYSDIFYTGSSGNYITKIYLNNKNGTFTDIYADLAAQPNNSMACADFDNDGDLDILSTPIFEIDLNSKPILYRNNMNFPNDSPTKPVNLEVENVGFGVELSWDPATDKQSTEGGLYYNLRVGKTPGGTQVISPMFTSNLNKRTIPSIGNAQLSTKWRLDPLAVGTYYWSVQAIDQSFTGGVWSDEQSFTVSQLRPYFKADTVCLGDSTSFTDQTITTGTQIYSWTWDFGDNKSSNLQNPKNLYTVAGTYTVTLTVTDTAGLTMTKTNPIIVLPSPIADFSISNVCIGTVASVVNTSNTDTLTITKWTWDYGDGTISAQQFPGTHGYLNTGSYDISLAITAKNGCTSSVIKPIIVAEYPSTNISASGNPEFCEGEKISLSVPFNQNYLYQWKVESAPITNADSNVFLASGSGNYKINVINKLANCISESVSAISVVVHPSPLQPYITTSGNLTFCQGDSVLLSVTNTLEYSYQWRLNGGSIGVNSNNYSAKASGTYDLVVSNSSRCSATSIAPVSVTVKPLPVVNTISLTGLSRFCSDNSTILSVPANPEHSFAWKNGATYLGQASNFVTVNETGDYSVEISLNGCMAASAPVRIDVVAKPARPDIDMGSYLKDMCLEENPPVLSVDNLVEGYTYQWYKNETPVSANNSIEVTEAANYYLEAVSDICTSERDTAIITFDKSLAKPVLFTKGPTVWILTTPAKAAQYKWFLNGVAITGATGSTYIAGQNMGTYRVAISNDGKCFSFSDNKTIPDVLGIEEPDPFENVRIYPNPTTGLFTIEMNNNVFGELVIDIFTQKGSKALNIKFEKTTEHYMSQIDLSGQSRGMYILNLSIDKFKTTRKILVE
jgi:PKD repeat protein